MVQLPTLHGTAESAAKESLRRARFADESSDSSAPQKDSLRAHGCSTSQPIHLLCTSAIEARPVAQQGPTTAASSSTPAAESVQHHQRLLRCGHAADKGRRHNMEDAAVIATLEGSVMPHEAACASPSVLLAVSACSVQGGALLVSPCSLMHACTPQQQQAAAASRTHRLCCANLHPCVLVFPPPGV